ILYLRYQRAPLRLYISASPPRRSSDLRSVPGRGDHAGTETAAGPARGRQEHAREELSGSDRQAGRRDHGFDGRLRSPRPHTGAAPAQYRTLRASLLRRTLRMAGTGRAGLTAARVLDARLVGGRSRIVPLPPGLEDPLAQGLPPGRGSRLLPGRGSRRLTRSG